MSHFEAFMSKDRPWFSPPVSKMPSSLLPAAVLAIEVHSLGHIEDKKDKRIESRNPSSSRRTYFRDPILSFLVCPRYHDGAESETSISDTAPFLPSFLPSPWLWMRFTFHLLLVTTEREDDDDDGDGHAQLIRDAFLQGECRAGRSF